MRPAQMPPKTITVFGDCTLSSISSMTWRGEVHLIHSFPSRTWTRSCRRAGQGG